MSSLPDRDAFFESTELVGTELMLAGVLGCRNKLEYCEPVPDQRRHSCQGCVHGPGAVGGAPGPAGGTYPGAPAAPPSAANARGVQEMERAPANSQVPDVAAPPHRPVPRVRAHRERARVQRLLLLPDGTGALLPALQLPVLPHHQKLVQHVARLLTRPRLVRHVGLRRTALLRRLQGRPRSPEPGSRAGRLQPRVPIVANAPALGRGEFRGVQSSDVRGHGGGQLQSLLQDRGHRPRPQRHQGVPLGADGVDGDGVRAVPPQLPVLRPHADDGRCARRHAGVRHAVQDGDRDLRLRHGAVGDVPRLPPRDALQRPVGAASRPHSPDQPHHEGQVRGLRSGPGFGAGSQGPAHHHRSRRRPAEPQQAVSGPLQGQCVPERERVAGAMLRLRDHR